MPILGVSPLPLLHLHQHLGAALRGTTTLPGDERRAGATGMALQATKCHGDL
jgi:hypothetical protein